MLTDLLIQQRHSLAFEAHFDLKTVKSHNPVYAFDYPPITGLPNEFDEMHLD